MSREYVAIISEGEKTEKQIIENIKRNFWDNEKKQKEIVFLPFKSNIYRLWRTLKEDEYETENGKIYVSYPMVEAIKDLKKQDICSRRCSVIAKENIGYKKI